MNAKVDQWSMSFHKYLLSMRIDIGINRLLKSITASR
jgi:hypothetical protein